MRRRYSVEGFTKHRGETKNMTQCYLRDVIRINFGYPDISPYGFNSDVLVYDARTGQLKRKETPNGITIEVFHR